jgi:hypothetical protein
MTRSDTPSQPGQPAATAGATHGSVQLILRLEGLVVLAFAASAYAAVSGNWLLFALLFLTPDLSMVGYLANRQIGAACYNAGHSTIAPAAIALFGFIAGAPSAYGVALIWIAHIGFDRLLGYGLKYASAFGDTHLGLKGKRA